MNATYTQVNPKRDDHCSSVQEMIQAYFRCSNAISIEQYDLSFDIDSMLNDFMESLHHYTEEKNGRLYLIQNDDEYIGLGGFHAIDPSTAELKRFYVKPQFRKKGYGKKLLTQLMDDAKSFGYSKLVLESVRYLKAAHRIYDEFGFTERGPYHGAEHGPNSTSIIYYMEKEL